MAQVTWDLSAQIYVPIGDTFTIGSSTMGGPDALGVPDFEVGDWVDLTSEAGEITIKHGFEENHPLAPYEVGTCDIVLRGLTYAPTLNEDVLPGVKIRVLVSHPTYYSEFAGTFEDDFLVTTNAGKSIVLFTGYILDVFEDSVNASVKIEAVDNWHKLVQYKDTANSLSYDTLSNLTVTYFSDELSENPKMYDAWPIKCTTTPGLNYYDSFTTNETFLTPIQVPGSFDWLRGYSGTATVTTKVLIADTPDQCVPGTATVHSTTTTSSGIGHNTKYWRLQIDVVPTAATYLRYVMPYPQLAEYPMGLDYDMILGIQRTFLGSFWMDRSNVMLVCGSSVWYWNQTTPEVRNWYSLPHRIIRVSDIHSGEHLCYYDFEQQTSLSSVLNSLEVTNHEGDPPVETTTVFEDVASVVQYGRRKTSIDTYWNTSLNGTWPGNAIINQTKFPEANVSRVSVELTKANIYLLPNLHDTVQFEYNGTTQYRRVSRVNVNFTPKLWTADIEFFDYTPFEGLEL